MLSDNDGRITMPNVELLRRMKFGGDCADQDRSHAASFADVYDRDDDDNAEAMTL